MSDGEGPQCALHFDVPSLGTCTRCGRFSCASCLVSREPMLCSACAGTVLDPFGLHGRSFEFLPAFTIAFRLIGAELPRLLAIAFIFAVPAAALQVAFVGTDDDLKTFTTSMRVSNLYEFFIGIIGAQATLALFIARGEGRSLSFFAAFNEGVGNWSSAVRARFRSTLHIVGFLLLLVVPGLWKATLLMFTSIAVLRSQERDALEASDSLVRNRFWLCLGLAFAAGCVCYVPLIGLELVVGLIADELYVPRFPLEVVTNFIEGFAIAAMTAVLYTTYVMLHRTAGLELAPMVWLRVPPVLEK